MGELGVFRNGKSVHTSYIHGRTRVFQNGKSVPTSYIHGRSQVFRNGKSVPTSYIYSDTRVCMTIVIVWFYKDKSSPPIIDFSTICHVF
jgi:hypothetical protein